MIDEDIKVAAGKLGDKIYCKIRRSYATDFHKFGSNIGVGADGTPTKYIDQVAEDVALAFMKKSDVAFNLLSEEAGFVDGDSEYTFVLDPVDGTRNASRGIPFYAVSLAVGKQRLNDVEYGIVKNVPTGDVFMALKGHGAFLNNVQIAAPEVPASELLASMSLGVNMCSHARALADKEKVRSLGCASLEMCMVAVGGLDYYLVGQEYIRVTDIAASTLVVREAGGLVTDIHGELLDMALSLDERTSVIAACSRNLVEYVVGAEG